MSSSAPTEIACAVSWFSNWSREQRRTFLDRIKEKEEENSLEKATEGLLKELENLKLTKRECPGVFECQLRIFDGWFKKWTDEDKMEFISQIFMWNDEGLE